MQEIVRYSDNPLLITLHILQPYRPKLEYDINLADLNCTDTLVLEDGEEEIEEEQNVMDILIKINNAKKAEQLERKK